ncbi:MAG TPA: hypothetical protein VGW38_12325 [Chloroflexota bacterium]|nr:hypothetical protein [Chloroflexota bacterium]
MQRRAACNAVLVSTHSFAHGTIGRPPDALHPGHGKRRAPGEEWLGGSYVPVDPQYYGFTRLEPQRPAEPDARDVDVLEESLGPAKRLGLRVYARIAENAINNAAIPKVMPGYIYALAIDHTGRRAGSPCLNNPDYKGWYLGTVEELVKRYPAIEGICIGMEGRGPLFFTMTQGQGGRCFCPLCRQMGRDRDLNAERARAGYAALAAFAQRAGDSRPRDGFFVEFLKILYRHPEVLGWEQLYYDAKSNFRRELYGAIKAIDRTKQVGWHLWHTITFDPFLRAGETFDEMPEYADWIKPAIYHNSGGLRTKGHVQSVSRTVWGDLSEQATYALYTAALGYADLPKWEDLPNGLPPAYIQTETRRVVEAVRNEIPVYPGIDVDVPVGRGLEEEYHRSEPEDVYAGVTAAFAGGAKGIVISRKYSEAHLENLDAVGAAVRALNTNSL